MAVAAAQYEDVDRRPRLVAERSHPVIVKTAWQGSLVIRSSANIDRHLDQSIVHRHHAISVSRGADWNDLSECAAQCQGYVLDQVMREIAARRHVESQPRVARKCVEHVIEKTVSGCAPDFSSSSSKLYADGRLFGLSLRDAHAGNSSMIVCGSSAPV